MCRICVGCLLVGCILMGRKEPKFLNPFYLFSLTPFTLLIYSDVGGSYMLELTHSTWVLAIINIYAFIFAMALTPRFKTASNCIGISSKSGLLLAAFSMYLLTLMCSISSKMNSLFWFSDIAAIVFALKTKSKVGYLFCALIFVSSILSGGASKMGMLLFCISFLVCYDKYYAKRIQWKKIAVLVLSAVVFMIFAFSFANKDRGHYDAQDGLEHYMKVGGFEWEHSALLFLPYMYLTTPWTNVQYVVNTQDNRTNGLWMIKPILGYIGVSDDYEKEYELVSYSSFNTFTFICCGFKDFGYWFSILASLFLGFFVKKVYSRYVISRSPFDITSYILVALATTEMFFSNHFYMLSYPFTAFIMMEFYKYITVLFGNRNIDVEPYVRR